MTEVMTVTTAPDYTSIKAKQRATWGSGDYAAVGVTLQIVAENLAESIDLRGGQEVLDVAAGNGASSLAAARRFCEVTSTDYVEELLERGAARAAAEGLPITFKIADAEALPFADESFDVVLSTFGAMFAPDQDTTAMELLRVCKRSGKIGMANWTPESFIGELFRTIGKHIPPAPGLRPPADWGTRDRLEKLFAGASRVTVAERAFNFRYRSPRHWIDSWRAVYGPVEKAFDALDAEGRKALDADLEALIARHNTVTDGTMVVPSGYLEVIVTK